MKLISSLIFLGSFALFATNGEIKQSAKVVVSGHACAEGEYYCATFKMCVPDTWDCSW